VDFKVVIEADAAELTKSLRKIGLCVDHRKEIITDPEK
jgi:hypothetical protein